MGNKILIIDDSAKSGKNSLFNSLDEKIYEVLKTDNVLDGVLIAGIRKPCLVICDLCMPEMNHFLNEKLNEKSSTGKIPVIHLLKSEDFPYALNHIKSGNHTFLKKPVSEFEFHFTVKDKLDL